MAIKHRIDEVYTACPFYGSRRITAQLMRGGLTINRKTVQRHMREMGIAGVSPGSNLSQRRKDHPVYPYLLHGVTASHPNHVWGIDVPMNSQVANSSGSRWRALVIDPEG